MTVDEIISEMEDFVEKKIPVGPNYYVEQAQKLVVLMGDETDILHELQKGVAVKRVDFIDEGRSAAEARMRVEATEQYKQMQNQRAKCERIVEIIRIAKIQSRMKSDEYKAGNL